MSTISRRAFLKTVGVGALSVAAMSVLAGCDVPGTTETVVTGTIEGVADNIINVADDLYVSVAKANMEVSTPTSWMTAYKTEYVKVINAAFDTEALKLFPATETTYDHASTSLKAEAADAAKTKADYVKTETATFTVTVYNYGEKDILLSESGDSNNGYKSSAIAVDGAEEVTFKVGTNSPVLSANGVSGNTVNVTAKVPCNAESYVLTVALPGAKAVKYTVKNGNYVKEIKPETFTTYTPGTKS